MSVRTSDESIQGVAAALRTAADQASSASALAHTAMTTAVADTERELMKREGQMRQAESAATAAAAALRVCQSAEPPRDCTGPARALVDAEYRLAEAKARVAAAEAAVRQVHRAQTEHFGATRRLLREVEVAHQGAVNLRSLLSPLERYRSVAPSSSPASAGSAPAPVVSFGGDLELVDLKDVDDSDSSVAGPGSFTKMSYKDAQWATEALQERVLPAVRAGKGRDYFAQRDAAEGRGHDRSYARLYDTYFGSTAIKLASRPDGKLEVIGGYHRIWAARSAGVSHLPARVRR